MWLRAIAPFLLVFLSVRPSEPVTTSECASVVDAHCGLESSRPVDASAPIATRNERAPTRDASSATSDELPAALTGRDLRVERFVLYTRAVDARGRGRAEVAGFVEWRKRETSGGQQMECDARFLREPTHVGGPRDVERVFHVECLTEHGPRCLWREVGPGMGRSVQAEWSEDGRALDLIEWSDAGKKRGTLVAAGGASMPLYLVELLRQGGLTAGSIVRFDPVGRTLESLEVRTVWLDSGGPLSTNDEELDVAVASDAESPQRARAVRTVELLRNDGSLAGRFRFAGLDLVAFQWQEGPLFARAVGADEFDRLTALHLPAALGTQAERAAAAEAQATSAPADASVGSTSGRRRD